MKEITFKDFQQAEGALLAKDGIHKVKKEINRIIKETEVGSFYEKDECIFDYHEVEIYDTDICTIFDLQIVLIPGTITRYLVLTTEGRIIAPSENETGNDVVYELGVIDVPADYDLDFFQCRHTDKESIPVIGTDERITICHDCGSEV